MYQFNSDVSICRGLKFHLSNSVDNWHAASREEEIDVNFGNSLALTHLSILILYFNLEWKFLASPNSRVTCWRLFEWIDTQLLHFPPIYTTLYCLGKYPYNSYSYFLSDLRRMVLCWWIPLLPGPPRSLVNAMGETTFSPSFAFHCPKNLHMTPLINRMATWFIRNCFYSIGTFQIDFVATRMNVRKSTF